LDIFNNVSRENLLEDAYFWFVTALFVGVGVSLPLLVVSNLILPKMNHQIILLGLIAPCFYSIMHLIFLKAIKCSLKTAKTW
jgi:hypothetical protein